MIGMNRIPPRSWYQPRVCNRESGAKLGKGDGAMERDTAGEGSSACAISEMTEDGRMR